MTTLKTREQVRKQFDRSGQSIACWARQHQCNQAMTYQVLYGKKQGKRGEAHRIAVLLGLKDGEVLPPAPVLPTP